MVNRLFNFDLEKKKVILKDPKLNEIQDISVFKNKPKIEEINKIPFEETEKKQDEEIIIRKNTNPKKTKKATYKRNVFRNDIDNSNMANSKTKAFSRESKTSLQRENSKGYSYQSNEFNNNKRRIIDKVRLNRCCVYFFFCFARRRKILTNVLINGGMDLISCKLDIA